MVGIAIAGAGWDKGCWPVVKPRLGMWILGDISAAKAAGMIAAICMVIRFLILAAETHEDLLSLA